MPNFEKSVGNSGFNLKHDVALLQACLKLLGVWEGRIDGEWSSNKAALEQRILLLEAHLKTKTLNRAQISPGSNFTNALKRKLPPQYQSLEGIKGTPCLTIDDSNASRIRELMVKDLILPDTCKQDIEKLQQDMKKALGLDLIVVEVRPDSLGYCILKLAPRNKACLDANLKPIPINGETPKDVKDIIDRKVNVLGQLRRVSTRRGIEVSTNRPVHKPEAVRASGPGASMTVPALSDSVLSGPVGTSGNKLEDVALVQAAFSMIAGTDGHALWNRGISGSSGTTFIEAIKDFQISIGQRSTGLIEPGSNEEAVMVKFLPKSIDRMAVITLNNKLTVVVCEGPEACAKAISDVDRVMADYSSTSRTTVKKAIEDIFTGGTIVPRIQPIAGGGLIDIQNRAIAISLDFVKAAFGEAASAANYLDAKRFINSDHQTVVAEMNMRKRLAQFEREGMKQAAKHLRPYLEGSGEDLIVPARDYLALPTMSQIEQDLMRQWEVIVIGGKPNSHYDKFITFSDVAEAREQEQTTTVTTPDYIFELIGFEALVTISKDFGFSWGRSHVRAAAADGLEIKIDGDSVAVDGIVSFGSKDKYDFDVDHAQPGSFDAPLLEGAGIAKPFDMITGWERGFHAEYELTKDAARSWLTTKGHPLIRKEAAEFNWTSPSHDRRGALLRSYN
ncbi:unnamed protein product [Symbiodinium microadriaticum]|nr:unnamed protein product [Symbiodinium microadriaticum]